MTLETESRRDRHPRPHPVYAYSHWRNRQLSSHNDSTAGTLTACWVPAPAP
jgi:hypothetical protein